MIELKQVSAGYTEELILRDISLTFQPGELHVLVGPNGCGKSTLLKVMLRLLPCRKGTIFYDGIRLQDMSAQALAQKAAFLTQSRETPEMEAGRLVLHGRFPWTNRWHRYSERDVTLAKEAMEKTKTIPLKEKRVTELSGGQRQEVYLAMLLAQETEYVFMDEPTTYLDIKNQLQLLRMAKELALQKKAVVVVMHDLALALSVADRISVLEEGSLRASDAPEVIYQSKILEDVFQIKLQRFWTESGWKYYCEEIGK